MSGAMQSPLIALIVLSVALPIPASEPPLTPKHDPDRSPPRPVISWPVKATYRRLYPDRVSALNPMFAGLPETRWDSLITFSGGRLEALNAGTGRPIWPRPVSCDAQPVLLGMDADHYVFATPHRIFALTRTAGRTAWHLGDPPPDDAGVDPEAVSTWVKHAMTPRRLYGISNRGDWICVDLPGGDLLWRRERVVPVTGPLAADHRYVCCATQHGRRSMIIILDAATGRESRTLSLNADQPVHALLFAPSGLLLAVGSKTTFAFDPTTGQTRYNAGTSGHFAASFLHTDPGGLFISDDGRRITKYDLRDGRILWKTPRIGTDARAGIWSALADGILFGASADALMAFDATSGRLRWRAKDPPGLRVQSPRLTREDVVTVGPARPDKTQRRQADHDAQEAAIPDALRYRIRGFDRATGREEPVAGGAPLLTAPLESFGGLFLRDHCLILLDGSRLIGYVEQMRLTE